MYRTTSVQVGRLDQLTGAKNQPAQPSYYNHRVTQNGSNAKVANSLVSASCAAVLAVYISGYVRTQAAADRFAAQVAERRVAPRIASPREKYGSRTLYAPLGVPSGVPAMASRPMRDAATAAPPAASPATVWKDGTYTGWGFSHHGNIEAAVVIEGGRIASATISQCRTRYSCSVIETLPPQVARRQSADVDYVSGATQSADAFYEAVVAALSKAK
jgi:uncharacterized protein with FMN-binding domain